MAQPVQLPRDSSDLSSVRSVGSDLNRYIEGLTQDALVEQRLAAYEVVSTIDRTPSILTAFTNELPRDGASNLRKDILECPDDGALQQLANHLISAILVPLKSRSLTPAIEPSPRLHASLDVELLSTEIESSSRDQRRLKTKCLERDGNRCQITGYYDRDAAKQLPPSELAGLLKASTQAAHIVPFSCGSFTELDRVKTSMTWDAIFRYFPELRSRLSFGPESINDPINAITLEPSIHFEFGLFLIALEATDVVNTYRIRTYPNISDSTKSLIKSSTVTLQGSAQTPAPSPYLLEAHAAIARVLHITAMGETIERNLKERENIGCLANDGSSNARQLLLAF